MWAMVGHARPLAEGLLRSRPERADGIPVRRRPGPRGRSPAVPTPRPISPWWWALVLAPVALGIGWMAGGLPGPQRTPEPSVSIGAFSAPGAGGEPGLSRRPASAPPVVYSEWTTFDDAVRQSRDNGKPV